MKQNLQTIMEEAKASLDSVGFFSFDIDYLDSDFAKNKNIWLDETNNLVDSLVIISESLDISLFIYVVYTLSSENSLKKEFPKKEDIVKYFDTTPPTIYISKSKLDFLTHKANDKYIKYLDYPIITNNNFISMYYSYFSEEIDNEKLYERLIISSFLKNDFINRSSHKS